MVRRSATLALGAAALSIALVSTPAAQAQDFLSALFGAFARPPAPSIPLPFAGEGGNTGPESFIPRPRANYSGGSLAY